MNPPLQTECGRIRFYPPKTTGGYWRLEWYEHGSRKQTSGGRTDRTATAKAKKILADRDRGSQALGKTRLAEVLDAYLRRGAENWADNQRNVASRELRKILAPYGRKRADEIDLRMLRAICNAASTANVARARRSHLRSFLRWGKQQDFFRPDQFDLLDEYVYVPDKTPTRKPLRRPSTRTNAESGVYVTPDEVMAGEWASLASCDPTSAGNASGPTALRWGRWPFSVGVLRGRCLQDHG
jgi:hypothetical protein